MPPRSARALTSLVCLAGLACGGPARESPATAADGPRLVLIIVVDQFRFDYLERFGPHLVGGLHWLRANGVVFTNANYDHALTVTAAGHAALATGLHPSRSGMINNSWYDIDNRRLVYSFDDPKYGRSPTNMLGTALPDWLKAFDPRSRAYSISHKDRSAIALGGHGANAAFWWGGESGTFESNAYYPDGSPEWLETFDARGIPDAYFGQSWEASALPDGALRTAQVEITDQGWFGSELPRSLGGPTLEPGRSFYAAFRGSPFADSYLLELAKTLVENEQLGQRDHLDYLALGLSVLDSVGHTFGPNSPEVADTILRLDRSLQEFLDFLDRTIGLQRIVIGFSSDHGVLPLPEYLQSKGAPGYRLGTEDSLCIQRAGLRIGERFGLEDWAPQGFYLDHAAIEAAGVAYAEVESTLAREIENCPIVERVWTRTELEATRPDEPDHFRRLYRHSFHPERSADLLLQLVENAIAASGTMATHGSPYEYDTHVPLILVVPGIDAVEIDTASRPVDLSPTLAAQIGIPYPDDLDGLDLSPVIAEHTGGQEGRPAYAASSGKDQ